MPREKHLPPRAIICGLVFMREDETTKGLNLEETLCLHFITSYLQKFASSNSATTYYSTITSSPSSWITIVRSQPSKPRQYSNQESVPWMHSRRHCRPCRTIPLPRRAQYHRPNRPSLPRLAATSRWPMVSWMPRIRSRAMRWY